MSASLDRVRTTLAEGRAALAAAATAEALAAATAEFLGKKGRVPALMELLKSVPPAEKAAFGKEVNLLKQELTALAEARRAEVGAAPVASGPRVDLTLPGRKPEAGALHPLTQMSRDIVRVMATLGFEETDGPEIEDEFHNFVALNIPENHPARDESDNFYLDDRRLLRSQTSTIQVRTMMARKPPLRVTAVGRVYRPDTVDATHHYMFHQVEGLAVDVGLTMADLKATLLSFVRALYNEDVEIRLRPSFFPFTEPSAEIDVKFPGRGWVEIGGSGMVDPAVFAACGLDPEKWTGFAFGCGVERLAMRRFDVPDIRRFTENDARFLRRLG
jgi:phenylalanyl-tRNA synthetase alpha chain